jgi:hypothetical protein
VIGGLKMNPQICFKQMFLQKICLLKIITNLNILKIMKKLQLNQMENLNGGRQSCQDAFVDGIAIACYGATFGGMFGGSIGLCVFAGMMLACK